eukprot:9946699-Ditylum_brightwellii.AAC.1
MGGTSSLSSSVSSTSTSDNSSSPATSVSHISLDTLFFKYPGQESTINKLAAAGHPAHHINIFLTMSGAVPNQNSP